MNLQMQRKKCLINILCHIVALQMPIEMAEDESKPLRYIEETVLKRGKSTEFLALARKTQLELGNFNKNKRNKKEVHDIKRLEKFVKEYRDQELDLIWLKLKQAEIR